MHDRRVLTARGVAAGVALAIVASACDARTRDTSAAGTHAATTPPSAVPAVDSVRPYAGVIDSTLPIEEALRRFRAPIPDTPTVLAGSAGSRGSASSN